MDTTYGTPRPGESLAAPKQEVNQLQQALSFTSTPATDDQVSQLIRVFQQIAPPDARLTKNARTMNRPDR